MNYGKMKPVNRLITKGCHFIPINTLSLWSKTPQHHVRLRIKGRCEEVWKMASCYMLDCVSNVLQHEHLTFTAIVALFLDLDRCYLWTGLDELDICHVGWRGTSGG